MSTELTPVSIVSSSGAVQTLNAASAVDPVYDITLTAACVLSLNASAVARLQTVVLILRQDNTGGRVATLPTASWKGGTLPTLTTTPGAIDILKFVTPDGSNWFGEAILLNAVVVNTTPLQITSASTATGPENAPISLALTANKPVTFSKSGGADAALFTLSGSTLTLPAENFEAPADADTNNVYLVQITATPSSGSPVTQNIAFTVSNVNDTNPSAFAFTDVTGATLGATETSNAITIAGLGASDSATATVSGDSTSKLSKNSGAFVAGPVTVVNGDTIAVQHTASSANATAVNTTLTVGTTSDTFTSTTVASSGPTVFHENATYTGDVTTGPNASKYVATTGFLTSNGDGTLSLPTTQTKDGHQYAGHDAGSIDHYFQFVAETGLIYNISLSYTDGTTPGGDAAYVQISTNNSRALSGNFQTTYFGSTMSAKSLVRFEVRGSSNTYSVIVNGGVKFSGPLLNGYTPGRFSGFSNNIDTFVAGSISDLEWGPL